MLAERRKVLTMLRDGKVSIEEAEQMLDLLGGSEEQSVDEFQMKLVGDSPRMKEVTALITKAARSDAPVLIVGETGTGKELVAQMVHHGSSRSQGPFSSTNCTVLSDVLQHSEVFGHERGAFTGAIRQRAGLLERTVGGTLFLYGIHALAPEVQAMLEKVLKGRGYTRQGGSILLYPDVRIVGATGVDLAKETAEGRFCAGLYDQLSIVTIVLPSLRERKEDVPTLTRHFLDSISVRDRRTLSLSTEALDLLLQYDWPGNVRELQNVLQRAAVLCEEDVLKPEDLAIENA